MPLLQTPQRRRLNVWIVEPESELRTLLVELSLLHGHTTSYAHDLNSASELLQITLNQPDPDLLVTAWNFGATNAQKWIQSVLQRAPRCRVICFTTSPAPEPVTLPNVQFIFHPEQLSELIQLLEPTRVPT